VAPAGEAGVGCKGDTMETQQTETFRLPFSAILTLSVKDALEEIRRAKKIRLGDLKVFDLIFDNDRPTSIWHGVYLS
jgi:hypothetical protein